MRHIRRKRVQPSAIEQLETRTLLSVGLNASSAVALPARPVGHSMVAAAIKTVSGPTLHETAGTPFKAALGFYATPVLDPPDGYSATINWGDTTGGSKAALVYGNNGTAFGINIDGTHTYAKAGTYVTTTTLVIGPINPASAQATTIIERIVGKAIVAAFPANSSNGVIIMEAINKPFTADLGTFTTLAPRTGLSAVITWGDGTNSAAVLKSLPPLGIDLVRYEVLGSHTYNLAGKYPIHVTVYRASPSAAVTPTVVATIQSTAIVSPAVTALM